MANNLMTIPFLALLIIIICLAQFVPLAAAGETEVALTCAKTKDSRACRICFNATGKSTLSQDLRGLAGSAIYCAFNASLIVRRLFAAGDYYSPSLSADPVVGERCTTSYDSAVRKMIVAIRSWKGMDYARSRDQMRAARDEALVCSKYYAQTPVGSAEVINGIRRYIAFAQVAADTVDQLLTN